ncbi:MAG: hypothetical protein A3E85_04830 [Gammaproteobacteria bacterium RIFCSPHIGHO2_12_FULL_45_12]|nr:MAG: hypothetical protein A3E85_04830 [Gammaproteobacteria bacterium RIFCSPHIGHO2_12_FULL_45_12]
MKNIFTEHPDSLNESYFHHFYFAWKFGFQLLGCGLACILHGIFPFIFQKTGSNLIFKMTHDFVNRSAVVEDRMLQLSKSLETKISSCQTNAAGS